MLADRSIKARGVYGYYAAHSDGDDILVQPAVQKAPWRFVMQRQQQEQRSKTYLCLADFVAPKGAGVDDCIGAFAVTAGLGVEGLVARYETENDSYRAIMVKALADRLAEAFAEFVHEKMRIECGIESRKLSLDELLAEKYRGIRPAYGYPACPDHAEKTRLFRLLSVESVGITLTESFAMLPAASVSGLVLMHPEARYFSLGEIGDDQKIDYKRRQAE
jgi:5-methyltetrahydrofolate--homocysteine methyltransferase